MFLSSDVTEVFPWSGPHTVRVVSAIVELKLVALEVSPNFSDEVFALGRDSVATDQIVASDTHALLLRWKEKGFIGFEVHMKNGVTSIWCGLYHNKGSYFCRHGDNKSIWPWLSDEPRDVLIFLGLADQTRAAGEYFLNNMIDTFKSAN